MKLALPHRGGFTHDDDKHRANQRAIEVWASAAKDSLQLLEYEELPSLEKFERHALIRAEGEYWIKTGDVRNNDEEWTKLVPDQEPYRVEATFSGTLEVGVKAKKKPSPIGGSLEEFTVELDAAVGFDSTFDLLKNGVSCLGVDQLTVLAGETRPAAPVEVDDKLMLKNDVLQIEVVSSGGDTGFVANAFIIAGKNALGHRIEVPGPAGPAGADGAPGTDGAPGADGVGVPVGGTAGQVLAKIDATDFNTEWVAQTGGGGGSPNLDGGDPDSIYGGITGLDGGMP